MWKSRIWQPAVLDKVEKYVLLLVFGILAYRMIVAFRMTGELSHLIYFADQAILVFFVLIRRSTAAITLRFGDWCAGFAGSFIPLLVVPATSGAALVPGLITVPIMLTGLAIHLSAKLTLRRSFGVVAANRGVTAGGPYKLVRHPMYAGYVLVQFGYFLTGPNLINLLVILSCWTLLIVRIHAEERLLSEDANYREMMGRTPFRLVPGLY